MKKQEISHEIMIIGGGASGLMAAVTAKMKGADAAVLEHTDKIGKKLLVTGNGRCNLTNLIQRPDCYRGHDSERAWRTIQNFSAEETILFFQQIGLAVKNRNHYIYPCSNQASSVLNALKSTVKNLAVPVYYRTQIRQIRKIEDGFLCETENQQFRCRKLILAAGSKAAEKTGSDGSGYLLAEEMGHTIYPVLPALTQLLTKKGQMDGLAGVRMEGAVSLYIAQKKKITEQGEIQLTNQGISGIPVFQVSRFASEALSQGKKVMAELDFCCDMTEERLKNWLDIQKERGISKQDMLTGLLNDKLARVILTQAETNLSLVEKIKHFSVTITGAKDFPECQVCMGGVSLREIDPDTMESLLTKGLYFAGEILDVDGICGGYNLQWAWSSGWLAGTNAAYAVWEERV